MHATRVKPTSIGRDGHLIGERASALGGLAATISRRRTRRGDVLIELGEDARGQTHSRDGLGRVSARTLGTVGPRLFGLGLGKTERLEGRLDQLLVAVFLHFRVAGQEVDERVARVLALVVRLATHAE